MTDNASASFELDIALKSAEAPKEIAELERLRAELVRDQDVIKKMNQAYRGLKTGGLETSKAAIDLKKRIGEKRKAVGESTAALLKLKGSLAGGTSELKRGAGATKESSSAMSDFSTMLHAAGGGMAGTTTRAMSLTKALGFAGIAGAAAGAVIAVAALEVAALKASASLFKTALANADAYRSENLALQGMVKTWVGWWGQIKAGNPDEIQKGIDRVTSSVTIAREAVVAHSEALYKSRLRGEGLTKALMAVSMAESAAGSGAAELAKNQIILDAMFGRGGKRAETIIAKYEKIVKQQMLAFGTQFSKAKENFSALFRGLDVTPAQRGLDKILGLLKQGTVESQAWSRIIGVLFKPLIQGTEEGGDLVENFLDRVTILVQDATLSWMKMRRTFSWKTLGLESGAAALELAAKTASAFAVGMLRAAQATLVFGSAVSTIASTVSNGVGLLGDLGTMLAGDWEKGGASLDKHAESLLDGLGPSKGAQAGFDLLQGVIDGIHKAQPALDKAVRESAEQTKKGYKDPLGIHSPSTEFAKYGLNISKGSEIGIRKGIPQVKRASKELANASIREQEKPRAPLPKPQAQAMRVNLQQQNRFGEMHFHASPSQPDSVPVGDFRDWLATTMEGLVIQMGAKL